MANFEIHANMFQVLASETRIGIIRLLQENGEMKSGDIAAKLETSMPLVSQHTAILRDAGFLVSRREKHFIYYAINENAKEAIQLAFAFADKALASKLASLQAMMA